MHRCCTCRIIKPFTMYLNIISFLDTEMAGDDVFKYFPRYWPSVRGIHRSPVNSTHKGQWRRALMFSLICALNKQSSKQSSCWWFETPPRSFWRHCNDNHGWPQTVSYLGAKLCNDNALLCNEFWNEDFLTFKHAVNHSNLDIMIYDDFQYSWKPTSVLIILICLLTT